MLLVGIVMTLVLDTQNGAVDNLPRHCDAQVQCSSLLNELHLISRLKAGCFSLLLKIKKGHPLQFLCSLVFPEHVSTWLREELEKMWGIDFYFFLRLIKNMRFDEEVRDFCTKVADNADDDGNLRAYMLFVSFLTTASFYLKSFGV